MSATPEVRPRRDANRLEVRAAGPEDLSELLRLDREVFGAHAYALSTSRQLLDLFPGLVLLAGAPADPPVGYAYCGLGSDRRTGWVLALGVAPAARRQGVGRLLVERGIDELARRGAECVRLTAAPDSVAGAGLYRALGFTVALRVTEYFGPGRDRLVLERSCGR